MFTHGKHPWEGVGDMDVIRCVRRGSVMERHGSCPAQVYDIMCACWRLEPSARPSAEDVEWQLKGVNVDVHEPKLFLDGDCIEDGSSL